MDEYIEAVKIDRESYDVQYGLRVFPVWIADVPELIALLEGIRDKEEETSMPPGLTGEDLKQLVKRALAEGSPATMGYDEWWDKFMGDSPAITGDDSPIDMPPTDAQRLAELESSYAVLREQVRELAGEVERLRGQCPGYPWYPPYRPEWPYAPSVTTVTY